MRKQSRVDPDFLQNQKDKRTATEDNPGGENAVPQLRVRVENLEHLLSVKSYAAV